MTRLFTRAERIKYHLNHEAYLLQMKGRSKPLSRFYPCPRSLCFVLDKLEDGGDDAKIHFFNASRAATLTQCNCHPGITQLEIERLGFIPWEHEQKFYDDSPA